MTTLVENVSARARFKARLAAFAEQHPELATGEAAGLFGRSLPDEDRNLVNEFLAGEATNILAWELRASFSRTRQGIFAAMDITNPDRPAIAKLGDPQRTSLFDRITQWREFVPSENRARLMLEFNRAQLLESAQYDAGLVSHHGWKMMLKTRLAEGLPDDAATVGSFYTPEQVAELGESIRRDMTRGNFRLKIHPIRPISRPAAIQGQADRGHPNEPEIDRGVAAQ